MMNMRMQRQVCYANLFWFSALLLQSCGSSGLDMADEELHNAAAFKPVSNKSLTRRLGDLGIEQVPDGPEDSINIVSTSTSLAAFGNRDTGSVGPQCVRAVAPLSQSSAQIVGDTQVSSFPCMTTFSTLEAAQQATLDYLMQWQLEAASTQEQTIFTERGRSILKGVETLKRATKRSYRQQVLGFETQDIDPLVWSRVLQTQKTTQSQLNALRGLRTQLLNTLQLNSQDMKVAGLRIAGDITGGVAELYSSDEEEQQISDQSRRNHAAFVVGVGKVLKKYLEKELLTLLGSAMGEKKTSYTAFSSTPELSKLLKAYIDSLQQGIDEEKRAELLGSLLTEAILRYFSLSKATKEQLNKIRRELGKAAYQTVLHYDAVQDTSKGKRASRCDRGPQA